MKMKNIGIVIGIIIIGLILAYLNEKYKEANYKNKCIELSTKAALNKFKGDKIGKTVLSETGLSIEELAKIECYKNCIK